MFSSIIFCAINFTLYIYSITLYSITLLNIQNTTTSPTPHATIEYTMVQYTHLPSILHLNMHRATHIQTWYCQFTSPSHGIPNEVVTQIKDVSVKGQIVGFCSSVGVSLTVSL